MSAACGPYIMSCGMSESTIATKIHAGLPASRRAKQLKPYTSVTAAPPRNRGECGGHLPSAEATSWPFFARYRGEACVNIGALDAAEPDAFHAALPVHKAASAKKPEIGRAS